MVTFWVVSQATVWHVASCLHTSCLLLIMEMNRPAGMWYSCNVREGRANNMDQLSGIISCKMKNWDYSSGGWTNFRWSRMGLVSHCWKVLLVSCRAWTIYGRWSSDLKMTVTRTRRWWPALYSHGFCAVKSIVKGKQYLRRGVTWVCLRFLIEQIWTLDNQVDERLRWGVNI